MIPKPIYHHEIYDENRVYDENRKYESKVSLGAEFLWHFRIFRKDPRVLIPALIYLIIDWLGILFTLNLNLPNIVSFPLILIRYPDTGIWIQKFPLLFAYLIIKSIYDFILFPIWVSILVKESLTENQPPIPLLKSFTQTYQFLGLYLLQFMFLIIGIVGFGVIFGLLSLVHLADLAFLFLFFFIILFNILGVTTFIVGIFRNKASFKVNFQDAWFIIKQKGIKLTRLSIERNLILLFAFIPIALINWGIMLLYDNTLTFFEALGSYDLSFYIMVFIYVNYVSLMPEIKNYVH